MEREHGGDGTQPVPPQPLQRWWEHAELGRDLLCTTAEAPSAKFVETSEDDLGFT